MVVDDHAPGDRDLLRAAAQENALLDAAIDEAAKRISLGEEALAAGIVTVALDEHGQMREYRPDGSTKLLT